ncbi:hypothetical protein PS838_00987 [Pseudomonas fluorescens]|nr:hypothetical protein PS838_00987 [Pseudomonas fluorescens]
MPCGAHEDAFAGKPAPTGFGVDYNPLVRRSTCRSWLASEGGLMPCGAHEDAFVGKPAPTQDQSVFRGIFR